MVRKVCVFERMWKLRLPDCSGYHHNQLCFLNLLVAAFFPSQIRLDPTFGIETLEIWNEIFDPGFPILWSGMDSQSKGFVTTECLYYLGMIPLIPETSNVGEIDF